MVPDDVTGFAVPVNQQTSVLGQDREVLVAHTITVYACRGRTSRYVR